MKVNETPVYALYETIKVLLQPLLWWCVECTIHYERDEREEQHPYISGANKL